MTGETVGPKVGIPVVHGREDVNEFGEFAEMIVDRQPALRDPVAQASARLLQEFEQIFAHMEKAGGGPAVV